MAVAATMMRGQCRACRLELDPRADRCWFCSTPIPTDVVDQARAVEVPEEDDSVLFARGVLLGVAMVLVPLMIRLAPLPI